MTTITAALSADHRRGDQLFDAAMRAAERADWSAAKQEFSAFLQALKRHMKIEEDMLFPAFEQATGMSAGPTAVMRHEHRQMLALLDQIDKTISGRDAPALRVSARSFAQLLAAHSAKEENILYPMCDQALGEAGADSVQQALSELARGATA